MLHKIISILQNNKKAFFIIASIGIVLCCAALVPRVHSRIVGFLEKHHILNPKEEIHLVGWIISYSDEVTVNAYIVYGGRDSLTSELRRNGGEDVFNNFAGTGYPLDNAHNSRFDKTVKHRSQEDAFLVITQNGTEKERILLDGSVTNGGSVEIGYQWHLDRLERVHLNVGEWTKGLVIACLLGFLLILCTVSEWFILLLPVLFGFCITTFYGVNVLFMDEWVTVHLADKVFENGISLHDLFVQHNEHRMFFPKIIFLLNAYITNLNTKVLMCLSWLLIFCSYGIIVLYLAGHDTISLKKRIKPSKKILCVTLLSGFLMFDIVQYENLLMSGFTMAQFMVNLFAILSFYFLYIAFSKNKDIYMVFTILSAVVASFSSLQGLFVLPAVFTVLVLLWLAKERVCIKYMVITATVMILISILYFYNYTKPAGHPAYLEASFGKILEYFLSAIGSPLIPRVFTGTQLLYRVIFAGFLEVAVSMFFVIYVIIKKRVGTHAFPLCLIFFGLASCAAITIGRVGFGVEQALSSRYTTFSLLIVVGLAVGSYNEFIRQNNHGMLKKAATSMLFIVFFLVMIQNTDLSMPRNINAFMRERQSIVLDYKNHGLEELGKLYPWHNIETAHNQIKIIEQHHWSVFAHSSNQ